MSMTRSKFLKTQIWKGIFKMARVSIAVQKPKRQKNVSKSYSTAQISKQLAGACRKLDQRTKVIERNEQRSRLKSRDHRIG